MPQDSFLLVKDGRIFGYFGPDALSLYRATATKSALGLWKKGIKVRRGVTLKILFENAAHFTQKAYKSKDIDSAISDLTIWITTMRSALPKVSERELP